ncbi:hypothetical protein SLEP1_g32650 [Rubroshorea leprosula]|uniref:WAT1-related protein n=1 Tax=Rubroshorea leprosula TaxID=152421 RepID=A0AAV5KE11_9ROSI|nr:hypothetical protein SLEP1_g32650 [Rubroshorea leprosula]
MEKKLVLPILGMVISECALVGLMIVGKAAMSRGMSNFIFVFYCNALASLILLPSAFLFHSCFAQVLGYDGIYYSSAALGTAMLNLTPGVTFILAIVFRMEKAYLRSSSFQAKLLGTTVSIAGAFIVTFYKGPALLLTSQPSGLSYSLLLQHSHWVIGGLLLAIDCLFCSAWIITQASILKKFPAELIVVFFYCFFVTIQSAVVCLVAERDLGAWSFKPDMRLIAILYSAVFGSAFQLGVTTWCLHRTGPVFVSMFKPLGIVISVVMGVIFLGDSFYLGSSIGAIVIVLGFYSLMWGKAREEKMGVDAGVKKLESGSQKVPLLSNNIGEA